MGLNSPGILGTARVAVVVVGLVVYMQIKDNYNLRNFLRMISYFLFE